MRFNNLTITNIKQTTINGKNTTLFDCMCDCGNEKSINAYNVIHGKSKTCGCGERLSRYSRQHAKDIRGQRFGALTVIDDTRKRATNGAVIWNCVCDCGNYVECNSGELNRGQVKSCGCKKVHANTSNIIGRQFGNLTVICIDKDRKRKPGDKLHWSCKCVCGNIVSVDTNSLTSGNTLSCGCTQMSYHEQYISELLNKYHIIYEQQKRFPDCKYIRPLPFDFYLPEINTAIEYDGRQHFEAVDFFGGKEAFAIRQRCDEIKNTYCKENNIRLIRLPYTMSQEEISQTIFTLRTRNE